MRNTAKQAQSFTHVESVMMIATAKTTFDTILAVVLPVESDMGN
jgi:hypothetical protein